MTTTSATPHPGPSAVARQTLKSLARRRLPPTPENFTAMYNELAGVDPAAAHPAARLLAEVAGHAVDRGGDTARHGRPLARAVARGDWESARALLCAMAAPEPGGPCWGPLLRDLLRLLEARHADLTVARKREAVAHVLASFGGDEARLHARLSGLVESWSATAFAVPAPGAGPAAEAPRAAPAGAAPDDWRELLAGTIETAARSRDGGGDAEAFATAAQCRDAAAGGADARPLAPAVRRLWMRWEMRRAERDEVLKGLASLLDLLAANVGELVADDRWMGGQVEAVRALLAQPVTRERLRDTERALRAVIYKQSARKLSLDHAKQALKDMVAVFVAGMEEMARSTGGYQTRIAEHRRRMQETDDLGQLSRAVEALLEDTRLLQADVIRRRDEVRASRSSVDAHEARIRGLEAELEAMSARVREDPLTGLLNRRGFEESLGAERARAARSGRPFTLALLDVDHFKRLNDAHGHAVGDRALEHLARVVRESLRPADVVARYGGEEFVILMPETGEAQAAEILVRVQRELTRRLFLADDEHVLVTFSAGVAQSRDGDAGGEQLDRADRALFAAKRAGRNRVEAAGAAA